MKRQSKFAVAGITGAMLIGAGAGVVLNLPSSAGASSAATATTGSSATTADSTPVTTPSTDSDTDSSTDSGTEPGKGARGEFLKTQLDALVKAGTITQAQEDAILAGIQAARPAAGTGDQSGLPMPDGPGMGRPGGHDGGGHGPGFGGGRWSGLGGALGTGIDAAATALGVTSAELKTDLEGGKTIADLAKDKGVDVQKVIDAIVAAETTELTKAVTDAVNGVKPTPPADAPATGDTTPASGATTPTTAG